MPIAFGALGTSGPQPPKRLGDFLLDQLLQELAYPAAHLLLQRIEPLACDEQIRRSHGTVSHGVGSSALVTP